MGDAENLLRRYLQGLGIIINRYRCLHFLFEVGLREKPYFVMGEPVQQDFPSFLSYCVQLKIHPKVSYRILEAFVKCGLVVNLSQQDPRYHALSKRGGAMPIYAVPPASFLFLSWLKEAFQKFRGAVER